MNNELKHINIQLARQIAHWVNATERLENMDDLASPVAWNNLESYLSISLRAYLSKAVTGLKLEVLRLKESATLVKSVSDTRMLHERLSEFRNQFIRVETTLDFFGDAINTRTSESIASYLRACDLLAYRSMALVLDPQGKPVPAILTYIDKGLGASILKAGLRLWDGTGSNPVAAIKITRHNLLRPTALIHEAGHQVAHITGWNEELSSAINNTLSQQETRIRDIWSSWASEIAADAFAFAHTGYGSVAALHDVLACNTSSIFRFVPGDPHPMGYIRILLGVEMCRKFYGAGSWDHLAIALENLYSPVNAPSLTRYLINSSIPILRDVVETIFHKPMRVFAGNAFANVVNPFRVSPEMLYSMEQELGASLYNSSHWIWTEALRLLALSSFKAATMYSEKPNTIYQNENWMLKLGSQIKAA
ncbi:MAG: hypothetical protein GX587_12980 [Bacteroidales bacterium]|nr:hypothetical protein [Bacteroidales bacterium]